MQKNIKLIDALQNMSSIAEPTMYYPQSVPGEAAAAAAAAAQSPRESFGPVFVVLAVIAVLAAVACVVGRICARRMRNRQAKRELPPPRGSYDGRREAATESPRPRPLPPLPRGFLAAKGDIEDGCYEIVFPAAKPVREKQQKADKKYGGGGNYTTNYPEIGGKRIGAVDSATFKQAKPST